MACAQLGQAEFVPLLAAKNATMDATDSCGRTALMLAAEEGHQGVVEALLEHGAAIDVADTDGKTALMKAAYRAHDEVVLFLLEHNANAIATDNTGRTAATLARLNNRVDTERVIKNHQGIEFGMLSSSETVISAPSPAKAPDWFIPSREIRKEKDPFSFGSFGKVYRGWWLNSRVVIKCVNVEIDKEKEAFQREARIWQQARHPNILPFFGACNESSPCFFVCEEATNGNLKDYLFREQQNGRSFVWRKLHELALGLLFLHERRIVHSDLKCNQVLISKDGAAMLTDFGLSFNSAEARGVGNGNTVGALRWKAPEVIRKDNPSAPNKKSDVYSLGMCIVEAVTGKVPWGDLPDPVVKFHVTREQFLPRPKAFQNDAQWELVKSLCAFDPSKRTELSDAIGQLQDFAQEELIQERIGESNETAENEM
ncbi:hypothetical protein BBJ29_004323 [Phytophthora kernoviae]|uniref:Protein kinase domain-containing protein n=1 Tax=Phytophthora kernoviae TaxID=325452 RepID=A0A3F2RYY6_9STRA|nr:hypothetical protein BBJ29_004323 [Phytophthora kernoviae]RLN66134.1 hypothetical protein BBP00_00002399 [Phytophthora kernoviae]